MKATRTQLILKTSVKYQIKKFISKHCSNSSDKRTLPVKPGVIKFKLRTPIRVGKYEFHTAAMAITDKMFIQQTHYK